MIYGEKQIQIVRDDTDLIGIRVLVLSQIWQPSTSEPLAALKDQPETPKVPDGVILVGDQTQPSHGAMRTTWTFQGIKGDGKGVTFKDRKNSIDFSFEPGFAQVPIQLHPDFQDLLDTYGGSPDNDGARVIWPTEIPAEAVAAAVGNTLARVSGWGGGNAKARTNPMFGIQDWFRLEGTYRFRYAERAIPAGLYDRAGTIMETKELPGEPPPTSDGRNWLFVPPPFRQRGVIKDITEMYWLSGPGGWPEPVYGTPQKGRVAGGGKSAYIDSVRGAYV